MPHPLPSSPSSSESQADTLSAAWRRSALKAICFGLWGLAVAGGSLYSFTYQMTPQKTLRADTQWPGSSICELSENQSTLVMFVHPRCPCSRASLNELAVLLTRCRSRIAAHVMFVRPDSYDDDWARTDLWSSASSIPGVDPHIDGGGAERQKFGARVSGEVFLYDTSGMLIFHGGITAGRGHAGDNEGRAAIESILLRGSEQTTTAPAFGCSLVSPDTPADQREFREQGWAER